MDFIIYILVFGAGFATGVIVANSGGGPGEETAKKDDKE